MSQLKYNDLVAFLTTQFGKIEERFEKIDQRLENLENGQDYLIKEVLELRDENMISIHRSRRMEEWIFRAAKKIDVPYNP